MFNSVSLHLLGAFNRLILVMQNGVTEKQTDTAFYRKGRIPIQLQKTWARPWANLRFGLPPSHPPQDHLKLRLIDLDLWYEYQQDMTYRMTFRMMSKKGYFKEDFIQLKA